MTFTIRSLTFTDVARINEIDRVVTMRSGPRRDADLWSLIGETTTSFGAESDGKLVGFVLADVRPWEFGARESVGWILALGVHPDAQGKGVGKALGDRVLSEFRRLGVRHAATLVDRGSPDLRSYFESLGFHEGQRAVLEASLSK